MPQILLYRRAQITAVCGFLPQMTGICTRKTAFAHYEVRRVSIDIPELIYSRVRFSREAVGTGRPLRRRLFGQAVLSDEGCSDRPSSQTEAVRTGRPLRRRLCGQAVLSDGSHAGRPSSRTESRRSRPLFREGRSEIPSRRPPPRREKDSTSSRRPHRRLPGRPPRAAGWRPRRRWRAPS